MWRKFATARARHAAYLVSIALFALSIALFYALHALDVTGDALGQRISNFLTPLYPSHVAIVTANFGAFDAPRTFPTALQSRVFIFNESNAATLGLLFPRRSLGARLAAKFPKFVTHSITALSGSGAAGVGGAANSESFNFRAYLWIDGAVRITDARFDVWMIEQLGDAEAAFFAHPSRNTVQQEIDYVLDELGGDSEALPALSSTPPSSSDSESLSQSSAPTFSSQSSAYLASRYSSAEIRAQAAAYARTGFNASAFPLLAGGVFIRRHTPHVDAVFDAWLVECLRWSALDQISLGFVIWRHALRVRILPRDQLLASAYHRIDGHRGDAHLRFAPPRARSRTRAAVGAGNSMDQAA